LDSLDGTGGIWHKLVLRGQGNWTFGGLHLALDALSHELILHEGATKDLLEGTGNWSWAKPGDSASGTLAGFRLELSGRETKGLPDGRSVACEKRTLTLLLNGTRLPANRTRGTPSGFAISEWTSLETGALVWRRVLALTSEAESSGLLPSHDGPAAPGERALLGRPEVLSGVRGLRAHPAEAGDRFTARGPDDRGVRFEVADGGTLNRLGLNLTTLRQTGTWSAPVQGSVASDVVRGGAWAGVEITNHLSFRDGPYSLEETVTFSRFQ
jgi:hypothetical protein